MLTAGTKVEKNPEAIYYEEIISRLINWKYVCGTYTYTRLVVPSHLLLPFNIQEILIPNSLPL